MSNRKSKTVNHICQDEVAKAVPAMATTAVIGSDNHREGMGKGNAISLLRPNGQQQMRNGKPHLRGWSRKGGSGNGNHNGHLKLQPTEEGLKSKCNSTAQANEQE
jgi:hypothetical protein